MHSGARALVSALFLVPALACAQDALQPWQPPAATATTPATATAPSTPTAETPSASADAPAASSETVTQPASADAAPAAAAPAATNSLIGPAPADKGQIVFYRESKFAGAALGFKVREGETELGKLRSGNYFVITAEPGRHEYNMRSEVKDVLPLEVEAGETYYVKASISMGILAGRPNLAPSDEASFLAVAKKLKLAK